jgi:hypothetical protein
MIFVKKIVPTIIRNFLKDLNSIYSWHSSLYEAPSPNFIKRGVLVRNAIPQGTYVETGTYLGDTTKFLAKRFPRVISLEPDQKLFSRAVKRLAPFSNVEIIHGSSEEIFPVLLPKLGGDVNFWLDGHYSGGAAWPTYKGESATPIVLELDQIECSISKFRNVSVLIDDVRSFQSRIELDYPKLDYLVDWARRTGLNWHIEHDVFVARSIGI